MPVQFLAPLYFIYEPFTPGKGEQFTGQFITRGNTAGKLGVAMNEMVDDLKGQIDRVQTSTLPSISQWRR